MSLFAAWVLFPLVLLALCAGLGMLVDLLCGRRLPGALVAPAGLAAIVLVAQLTTLGYGTAQLTVPLVVLLAALGAGLSWPWRFRRPDPWPLAAALGVFCVFAAPIVLSGHPTFAGYVELDDTATWIAMTDRLMEHGRSLSGLEPSTFRATLGAYTGAGYPVGANLPWGVAGTLVGGDLAWTFAPYLAFLAAMLSLSLGDLCRSFIDSTRLRAVLAFLASQAALFYGYYLWGGMKEIASATLIALAAALLGLAARAAPGAPDRLAPARATLPLAVALAALLAALSPAGVVWVAPLLLGGAIWALRELGPRAAAVRAAWLLGIGAALSVPLFVVGHLTPPVEHSVTDSSAVLNLLQPLHPLQVFGVWPSGDFRLRPDHLTVAWLLAGLAAALAAFGVYAAARTRAWPLLGYLGTSILGCLAIVSSASPWIDGKAMATASPAFFLAALAGAAAIHRRGLRLEGGVLLALLAGGVLWSNVLAYGGASLAPYGQLRELQTIGEDFAGQGPALMTEYNPYGARHFLRKLDGEAASELRNRAVPLRGGGEVEKGYSADTDELDPAGLFEFRTLVLRRSPVRSRPPLPYRLAWSGDYYEVWQRPADATEPPSAFLPLGGEDEPAAVPDCEKVEALAGEARASGAGRLTAARHAPAYDATEGPFEVPRGRYTGWLEGSVRGSVELLVDGRKVGEARQEIENDGGFVELGTTPLQRRPPRSRAALRRRRPAPGLGRLPPPRNRPAAVRPGGRGTGRARLRPDRRSDPPLRPRLGLDRGARRGVAGPPAAS